MPRLQLFTYTKRNQLNSNPWNLLKQKRQWRCSFPSTPVTFPETTTSTESEQDAEYSLKSIHVFTEKNYVSDCPKLNTKEDSEVEDLENELKFIAFESMLNQLFISGVLDGQQKWRDTQSACQIWATF